MDNYLIPQGQEWEEREKNLQTISDYFELEGDQYSQAWKFYDDQAFTGIYTTENAIPEGAGGGIENIKEWYRYNTTYSAGWKNNDVIVFQRDDPDKFYVRSFCEGDVVLPDYKRTHIKTLIHHYFEMRGGKITVHWIHYNPAVFIRELGAGKIPPVKYPIVLRPEK